MRQLLALALAVGAMASVRGTTTGSAATALALLARLAAGVEPGSGIARSFQALASPMSASAIVLAQQDDPGARLLALQPPRGPEARVAATDDDDVGGRVGGERRQRRRSLEAGLPDPVSVGVVAHRVAAV